MCENANFHPIPLFLHSVRACLLQCHPTLYIRAMSAAVAEVLKTMLGEFQHGVTNPVDVMSRLKGLEPEIIMKSDIEIVESKVSNQKK